MTKPLPPEQLRRQPKGERRKTGHLGVRWTKLEADVIRLAAQVRGLDASEAVRTAALAWAREVLASTEPHDPFNVPVTAETLSRRTD